MKKSSMTILALIAASGTSFSQTAANMMATPVAPRPQPSGTHQFLQRGETANFTMCTFEMCRRGADGRLKVLPVAAGSPAAVVAQASVPDEENYIVFYPAGKEGIPEARRVLRNRYLVKLKEGANMAAVQARCGMKAIKPLFPGSQYAVCEEESAGRVLSQIKAVIGDPDIESVEPLLARKRSVRAIPTDPFYPVDGGINGNYQWYLNNVGANGGVIDVDINLEPALDFATGNGVNVAVVDDGVAIDHEDLAANATGPHLNLQAGVGTNPTTFDPTLNHGTGVAGLLAAAWNNNLGISGAAPEATLSAIRLLGDFFDDADEAAALSFNTGIIDVSNNSWGPTDITLDFEAPGTAALAALENGVMQGRPSPTPGGGNLGVVYVWSAGNGGDINDNSNYDGYANSIYTIAVGAVTDAGRRSGFSERGANLVVSAPSDGGAQALLTTEFGVELDEDDNPFRTSLYTTTFGGTSAAAPLVSGVVALMLEANPNLSWRDVQDILIRTAVMNDPINGGWIENAAGLHFNHDFGAGLVDAAAAREEAAARGVDPDRPLLGPAATPQESFILFRRDSTDPAVPNGLVPDSTAGAPGTYQVAFDFSDQTNLKLEHVEVNLTAITQNRSDLEIVLISPSGTQSILQETDLEHNEQGVPGWTFSTVRNWGEDSAGVWLLRVVDRITGNAAILNDATVTLHGVEDPTGSVDPMPLLVSSQLVTADQGQNFEYLVETVGATRVTIGDLPDGVTFDPITGLISGAATDAGVYQLQLLLHDADGGTTTATVTLVVRPVAVALGAALGLPDFPVVTAGTVPWDFEFTDTNDGDVPADQRIAATSGPGLGNEEESIFGFNGLPQGVLMFDWRTSSEEGADRLWFNFNGDVPQYWRAFISGERGWGTIAVQLPEPANNVRWIYSKNAASGTGIDTAGEDRGLVDNVRLVDLDKYREDVISAANLEGFEPEFDSRALWMPIEFDGQATPPDTGGVGTALRNSTIGNGQTVSMSAWLEGPGTLTFISRNFAEAGDVFEVLLGGVVRETQVGAGSTGPVATLNGSIDIPEGRQRMQMRFRKDFRGSDARTLRGQFFDGVLLDEVKFVPVASFNTFASSFGPDVLLPHDDLDGDGYTNHEEYAFGGDVLVSDIPKYIPKLINKNGATYIEYAIDTRNADLNYIPQQSSDMENWIDAQLVSLDRVEGEIEYYQIPVLSLPGREHIFYRVLADPK